jgi:hypothetical protein
VVEDLEDAARHCRDGVACRWSGRRPWEDAGSRRAAFRVAREAAWARNGAASQVNDTGRCRIDSRARREYRSWTAFFSCQR